MRPEPCKSWCIYERTTDTCIYCGWPRTPMTQLEYFDIATGSTRPVTQDDINRLSAYAIAFDLLRTAFREVESNLQRRLEKDRAAAGRTAVIPDPDA